MQNQLDQRQELFCIAVQKAIVSHSAKALGEDMLYDQVNEILAGQSSVFYGLGLAFDIPKSNLAVCVGDDVLFGDHAFVQVFGKVFDGFGTFADVPAVDDPFARGLWNIKTAFAQLLQKACAKDLGEIILFKQKFPFFLFPLLSGTNDATAWYDRMNMGMVIQSATVGMQHHGHPDFSPQVLGVQSEILENADNAQKEQGVDLFLETPGQ
jgi:hypothetical protein